MYKMSVVVAIAVLLVSCGDEVVDGDAGMGADAGRDGGTSAVKADVKVVDARGQDLGLLLSGDEYGLTVYSPTGYVYGITWGGDFAPVYVYYDGVNCGGNALLRAEADVSEYYVVYEAAFKRLLRPSNGGKAGDYAVLSMYGGWDAWQCTVFPAPQSGIHVPLMETTRTEAGIPAVIVPPISFK